MTPAEELRAAAERVRDEPELVDGRAIAEPLAALLDRQADLMAQWRGIEYEIESDFRAELTLARAILGGAQ